MSTKNAKAILERMGAGSGRGGTGEALESVNPATGAAQGRIRAATRAEYDERVESGLRRFEEWRMRPAPRRGEVVRGLGELLRQLKEPLGELVSLETGKIRAEGLGEVQEMIDICEFAVGLSRQLHGLTIASERPCHRLMEQWHPLGPVGIVTAFNFPVGAEAGGWMCDDPRLPLVSFTGSIAVGRQVASRVASRLGRSLLELGGNNGVIVLEGADLELAVRAITFGAVGTAGQRCTSTRRLFVQRGIACPLLDRLVAAYRTVKIGDPLDEGVLMGPLVTRAAVERFSAAVAAARAQGGEVRFGGRVLDRSGNFVEPTLIVAPRHDAFPIAWEETFAPILYVFEVTDLDEALRANNAVPQGLSSALFTDSLRAAERFLSASGSDCGIANVNTGTSGAEIGGAFGGEKDTGGGRESGSDAWKAYMRRQTSAVNWGRDLPLAQGIQFG